MSSDIHRLLDLQHLLLAFSQVERGLHRRHKDEYILENDTEHSYSLAMTAWYLAQYFPDLNRDKLIRYALVHDLLEVHAGDTYIYGSKEALASKQEREEQAMQKLEKEWSDFDEMIASIHDYEKRADAESCFIYALDKIMPIMQVYINDGYSWKVSGVTAKIQYDAKIDKVRQSPEILPYFEELQELLLSRPDLIKKS